MTANFLRQLVDMYLTTQKTRVAFRNREFAASAGMDDTRKDFTDLFNSWAEQFEAIEKEMSAVIDRETADIPIINAMRSVKGVGPILAAKIISFVDFNKADTVSALWRYAGYAVFDGERERRVKGEKLHYNARLKTTCYILSTSMLRSRSPYAKIYDEAKEQYHAGHPDWRPIRCDLAARRKMIKVFLQHLWITGRTMEGLPITQPYAHDILNHSHYMSPEEFGWPSLADSE